MIPACWQPLSRVVAIGALMVFAGCAEQIQEPGLPEVVEPEHFPEDRILQEFLTAQINAAKEEPESALFRGRLGMTYNANRFSQEALAAYANANILDPSDPQWYHLRAHQLADLGDLEAALADVEKAIEADPTYVSSQLSRGTWLLDLDRPEQALDVFERLIAEVTEQAFIVAAHSGRCQSLLRLGRNQELVATCADGEAFEDPFFDRLLGQALLRDGDSDRGRKLLDQTSDARAVDWPDRYSNEVFGYVRNFSGTLLLAEDLLEVDEIQTATSLLENLHSYYPDEPAVQNNLAIAYIKSDRLLEAQALLVTSIEASPDNATLHFNLGQFLEESGEFSSALSSYDRSVELNAGLLPAYERLLNLRQQLGEFELALETMNRLLELSPATPALYYEASMLAGIVGKWNEAASHLRKSLELNTAQPRAYLNLTRIELVRNNVQAAKEALASAKKFDVDTLEVQALEQEIEAQSIE